MYSFYVSKDELVPPLDHSSNPSQAAVCDWFLRILRPTAARLNLTCERSPVLRFQGSPLLRKNQRSMRTIHPDIVVRDEGQIVCVAKIIKPYLFPDFPKGSPECPRPEEAMNSVRAIAAWAELQLQMIVARSRYGIIFDGYFLMMFQLIDDVGHYEAKYLQVSPRGRRRIRLPPGEILDIPENKVIFNVLSTEPYINQGILTFLEQCQEQSHDTGIWDYMHLILGNNPPQI